MRVSNGLSGYRYRQLWYVPLLSLAMGLMMVRTLVMAKLLDVSSFAQFSGGQLVSSTFSMLGCLGLQFLLQREMPVQIVLGRERAAAVLLVQCLIVAAGCAIVGLLLTATGLSAAGLSPGVLAIGMLHGLSQQVFLVATVESRSREQPLRFASQKLERAGLALAVGCGVGAMLGSAGAVLLSEAIVSYLLTLKAMPSVLQQSRLKATVVCGIAIHRLRQTPWGPAMALLALMFVSFAFLNVDRWFAAQLLQPAAFALYAFAWVVLSMAQSLQAVINASVYPSLARTFANGGRSAAFGISARASIGLLLVCVAGAWPAYWLLGVIVTRWFPAYAASKSILGIFLLVAALRLSDFWTSYLVIVGLERRLLVAYLAVGLIVCGGWSYVAQPWSHNPLDVRDVAWLAMTLTVAGYLASCLTAVFARKKE